MTIFFKDQQWIKRQAGLFSSCIVALLCIGLLTNWFFFNPHSVTVVTFDKQQCIIEGDFELMWLHSVEKQWWIEAYEIEANHLLLTDAYLQTFGAGTPSTEALSVFNNKHPGYINYHINTRLPYLNWMISSNIKAHVIDYSKRGKPITLPIYKWVDDYTNIHFVVETQNLWKLRRQESCYDYSH